MSTLSQAVDATLKAVKSKNLDAVRDLVAADTIEWWAGAAFSSMVDVEAIDEATSRTRVAIYLTDGTMQVAWTQWEQQGDGWTCTAILSDKDNASEA